MKEGSLKKNAVFNIVNTSANVLFPLIIALRSSRILLADGVGHVAYAQSIASYFIMLSTLGMPTYALREIAKLRGNRKETDKLFSELFVLNGLTTVFASGAYLAMLSCVQGFKNDLPLFFACGLPIFVNVFNVDWFFCGHERYDYIALRNLAFKVLTLLMMFMFVRKRSDYLAYAWILNLATCGNYVMNIFHIRRYVTFSMKKIELRKHVEPLIVFALSSFLSTVYSRVDVTMLGIMKTDAAVGYYEYSHKIIDIVASCCIAATSVFLPRLSYYYKTNLVKFSEIIEKGVRAVVFVVFPAFAGIVMLAPQYVLLLFGESFSPAIITLRLLAVIIVIKGLGDLVGYQIVICTGNEKVRLPSHAIAMVANIIINALLIPRYGENGAVTASVVTLLIVNGYFYCQMRKIVHIPINKQACVQAVLSSLLMCIVLRFSLCLSLPLLWQSVFSTCLGFAAYIGINLLIKNELLLSLIDMSRGLIVRWMKKK